MNTESRFVVLGFFPKSREKPDDEVANVLLADGWDEAVHQVRKVLQEGKKVALFERLELSVKVERYPGWDAKKIL